MNARTSKTHDAALIVLSQLPEARVRLSWANATDRKLHGCARAAVPPRADPWRWSHRMMVNATDITPLVCPFSDGP